MSKPLIDFRPEEEQQRFCDVLHKYATEGLAPIAAQADEDKSTPQEVLEAIHSFGLTRLAVPEAYGGFGVQGNLLTNVLAVEQLARGDGALAIAGLTPLAVVNILLEQATKEQQRSWLPCIVQDQFVACCLAAGEALDHLREMQTTALKSGAEYVLTGEKRVVAHAESVDYMIVVARENDGTDYLAFWLGPEELNNSSVTRGPDPCMGMSAVPTGRIKFDGTRIPASARIGDGTKCFDRQDFCNRSSLGICSVAVGTCSAVLDYVTSYVNEREAFGEPLANRQAVAFMVADMAIELEAMRLLLWRATSRYQMADRNTDELHAEIARLHSHVSDYAMKIGTDGVQLLGGHGFVREHPVERWYRQLRGIAVLKTIISV